MIACSPRATRSRAQVSRCRKHHPPRAIDVCRVLTPSTLVTDKDLFRHVSAAVGWLAPGELRVFDPAQEAEATSWLAESGGHRAT